MGNTHKNLNYDVHNSLKNSKKNNKTSKEKDTKNNKKDDNYDKELRRVLFDEEDKSSNNNDNYIIKKSHKEELQDYAQEIADEQFMEELNRSKSVSKIKKDLENSDDDSESFEAFKKWKMNQKKMRQKLEEKQKNEKDIKNIKTINNNDDKYVVINNGSKDNNDNNLNINQEIKKKNNNFDKIQSIYNRKRNNNLDRKPRATSSDKSNFIRNNIKKKYNTIISEKNNDNNKVTLTKEKEDAIKKIMKTYSTQNLKKTNNFRNNNTVINNLDLKKTNIAFKKTFTNGFNSNDLKSKTSIEKNDTDVISKKLYEKIKKEDLKIMALIMKNGNRKYEEGLQLCGYRKYNDALTSFAQSRSSFFKINKMLNNKNNDYPTEFKMIMAKKINEKLKLVNQSIRESNELLKKYGVNKIVIKAQKKPEDILKHYNIKEETNNLNFSSIYDDIDDQFDFNSPDMEEDISPYLKSNPKNNNNNIYKNNNQQNKKQKNIHEMEDSEMDAKIESEIMQTNPGVKFSDIIGMQEMKKILYEIIVVPTIRPDLFTGIRKPQRGILLFGPPGTGKTLIAKAIASECNSTFFNISASSLTSKWVGESEKTVKSLFKLAYKKAPSIIFIDEIDSILSKRNESENEATKRLKTEFLIQFDGLGSNNNARLLVIAATNRPMDLDEALLRRLPKRVYCGPLDERGRFEFIKKVINRVETKLSDNDIIEVAKMTNGYSNSDLKELCKEAAFQPVRELTMEQIMKIKKFRPLYKKDLVKAVHKIRGTMSDKIIRELIKWNEQFGGV